MGRGPGEGASALFVSSVGSVQYQEQAEQVGEKKRTEGALQDNRNLPGGVSGRKDTVDRLITLWTTPGKRWLYVRVFSVASSIPVGFLAAWYDVGPDTAESQMVFCVVALPFPLVALPLLLSIQTLNPLLRRKWSRPSWFSNPYTLRDPLQGFHLDAFAFMAFGFGALLTLPFVGFSVLPFAIGLALIGVGTWLGVRLCMVLFRWKMEDP